MRSLVEEYGIVAGHVFAMANVNVVDFLFQ